MPDYYEKFCNLVNVVKLFGGSIGDHNTLVDNWCAPGTNNIVLVPKAPDVVPNKENKDEVDGEDGDNLNKINPDAEARELATKEYLVITLFEKACPF
eukprot:440379-Ditylum_brightwellii.AAC.1